MDGRSGGGDRRPYYSESMSSRLSHGFGELRAFFVGPWKYIHGPRPELFHLEDDPRELHDLVGERPEERQRLEAALVDFLAEHASAAATDAAYEASEETKRRLAALGYLSTGGDEPQTVTEELRTDGAVPQDRVGDINLQTRLRRELAGGMFRSAERTARRLLEVAPENAYFRASLVSALLGLGETEKAARWAEEPGTVSSVNVETFLQVAQAIVDDGDPRRGLELARRLVAAEETADTRMALARMLRDAGDDTAFEATVERALELDAEHRGARLELARYLIAEESFARADDELRRLLADFPVDAHAHLLYVQLLRATARRDEALGRLERVLRLAPGFCEARLERVVLLVELDRPQDAATAAGELRKTCDDDDTRERATALLEEQAG